MDILSAWLDEKGIKNSPLRLLAWFSRSARTEHVKLGIYHRLSYAGIRAQCTLSHTPMLSTAKQEIPKGVANVRVFVFIWCIAESFLPRTNRNTLKMIPAGKGFPEELALLVHNETRLAID
jgi:hypothetical protein